MFHKTGPRIYLELPDMKVFLGSVVSESDQVWMVKSELKLESVDGKAVEFLEL